MAPPYLDIQNLTKSIGDLVLFEDISFSVSEGQHVGLIARNGAGKSTLLGLIAGKDSPDSGDIVFQKGLRVGMLEQQPDFDPEMSVLQAVAGRLRAEYASLFSCVPSRFSRNLRSINSTNRWACFPAVSESGWLWPRC